MVRKMDIDSTNKKVMLVHVLLDASGSMLDNKNLTIDALKEFISGLKKESIVNNLNIILTIKTFASDIRNVLVMETLIDKQEIAKVIPDTVNKYSPDGGTPLYDAIGEYINNIVMRDNSINMFVIQTDGYENTSGKYAKNDIKKLIDKQSGDGWQFIFLGCNFDAMQESMSIGLAVGNTYSFSSRDIGSTYSGLASAVSSYAMYENSNIDSKPHTTDTFIDDYLKDAINKATNKTERKKRKI